MVSPDRAAGAFGEPAPAGATSAAVDDEQPAALKIEQRGIDLIPASARHLRLRDLGFMWAAATSQVTYVVYGAFVIYIGLSFLQAVAVILAGSLTFLLVGAYSVQGPRAGTSTFVISRAAFGP